MPGLTAPSDYAEEPPRHPALKINSKVSAMHPSPRDPHPLGDSRVIGFAVSPIARIRSRLWLVPSRSSRLDAFEGFYDADALAD